MKGLASRPGSQRDGLSQYAGKMDVLNRGYAG